MNGRRTHWRLTITLHDDEPHDEILRWTRHELLPVLVPALEAAPVSVTLALARPDVT